MGKCQVEKQSPVSGVRTICCHSCSLIRHNTSRTLELARNDTVADRQPKNPNNETTMAVQMHFDGEPDASDATEVAHRHMEAQPTVESATSA